MERVLIEELDSRYIDRLPEESGVVSFHQGQHLLYVTETVNLKYTVRRLSNGRKEDPEVADLFNQADTVSVEQSETGLDAVIRKKLLLEKGSAEFNQRVQLWKHYSYLAVNPAEFPFVKITEFTDGDWFYLGPFRSRFFMMDVLELTQRLLKVPYCEVKSGPCDKLDDNLCRGWCELIRAEAEKPAAGAGEQPQLQKLDALLKEAFVHADNGLLDLLLNEKRKYEEDLQFAKADLLKNNIAILQRYKDWLIFLYKIKNLNFATDKVSVKGGQLIRFKAGGKDHLCSYVNIAYRPNEALALNKNLVDEARILYQECK